MWNQLKNFGLLALLVLSLTLSGCASLDKAMELNRKGDKAAALKMAMEYLEDSDPQVRISAVRVIEQIGGKEAGAAVATLIRDKDPQVQVEVIRTLGRMRYSEVAEVMVDLVPQAAGELFEALAEAFAKMEDPAIDLLVKKFERGGSMEEKYQTMLVAIGPVVASSIAKSFAGKSVLENSKKFDVLAALKNPSVPPILIRYIDNVEVGELVVEGLVKLGSMSADAALVELQARVQQGGNETAKERLIKVLGELNQKKAIPLLERINNTDASDVIRAAADRALFKIRGF